MLPVNRSTILQGPCLVIYKNYALYTKGDVTVTPVKSLFDIDTLNYGKKTDQRLKDIYYKVAFTPDGEATAALIGFYTPYASLLPGQSIFGATDSPLTIITQDSTYNQFKFSSGALTKMSDLNLVADATLFDAIEFTCIGAKGAAYNASNRLVTVTTKTTSGTITGTSDASPDVVTTSAAHGLAVGDLIYINGVLGDTAINGTRVVATVPTSTTFTCTDQSGNAIAGNGAYTSGGTWTLGAPFSATNILTGSYSGSWATTLPSGTITGTSDANPDVITTSAAHGLNVGDQVTITSVGGDTAVDGTFYVIVVGSSTTFQISATKGGTAIAGSGTYTSGGTFTRANPLDLFDTEAGFKVNFSLTLNNKMSDGSGLYDIRFGSLTVSIKAKPLGPQPTDMLAAIASQGSTTLRGGSMAAQGQDLYIDGSGLYVKLSQAFIATNPTQFSDDKLRVDDVEWMATRSFTGANANALFQISTTTLGR